MNKTFHDLTTTEISTILSQYRLKSNKELSEQFQCVDIPLIIKEWRAQFTRRVQLPRVGYEQTCVAWREEIADYYQKHSPEATCAYFCIRGPWLKKILAEFNIPEQDRATALLRARIDKCGSIEAYNQQVNAKCKATSMERYGVDNYAKTIEFRKKSITTSQEHWGVDNPMQSATVRATLTQTNNQRYGVDWPQSNSDISAQTTHTCNELYGGRGWASNELRIKSLQTHTDRYGSTHWRGSEELTAKVNHTCLEKHGVEWPCQYPEVKQHYSNDSKPNRAFEELLIANNITYEREFGLGHYSYDFKINNVLVEIDPAATHNSTWGVFGCDPTPQFYHRDKSQAAEKAGYRCIHVFDWDNVYLIIQQLKTRPRVYARQCEVGLVDDDIKKQFVKRFHLQKDVKSTINVGLYYNGEIVSVMTFGKPRYNKNYEYELLRYCSSYQVVGGAEKIWKYFIENYSPNSIISYCDKSKFTGKVYEQLGMTLKGTSVSKHWYNMQFNKHVTDNLLRQRGFDQLFNANYGKGTSNEELMKQHKFVEIYDAGQSTYIWNKQVDC